MLFGKLERNTIFAIIQRTPALDPNDFEIGSTETEAAISHVPTGSMFETINVHGFFTTVHTVGDGPERQSTSRDFSALGAQVSFWALELRRYIEAPDLWQELRKESEFVRGLGQGDDNSQFNEAEKTQITDELRRVTAEVMQRYQLSADQFQALSAKVDYVIEALDRSGRADWSLMFVGMLMSYLLTVGLPSEQARSFFALFMGAMAHFLREGMSQFPIR